MAADCAVAAAPGAHGKAAQGGAAGSDECPPLSGAVGMRKAHPADPFPALANGVMVVPELSRLQNQGL